MGSDPMVKTIFLGLWPDMAFGSAACAGCFHRFGDNAGFSHFLRLIRGDIADLCVGNLSLFVTFCHHIVTESSDIK